LFTFFKKRFTSWIGHYVSGLLYARQQAELKRIRSWPNTSVHEDLVFGEGSYFNLMEGFESLHIERGVSFRRYCHLMLSPGATLVIRSNVFFNNNCSINCLHSIEIGENTLLGEGVRLYDHNHKYSFSPEQGLKVKTDSFRKDAIRIGKNCWIGSNVTILKGVEVGDNVIIGANCLIHRSVPANSVVKHSEELIITPIDKED